MHETPDDLALTVAQFSKAIAEEPFKLKQKDKEDQEQFFVASENKTNENVQVRDSDGLERFWQYQLMKLPLVTWDVSQSITRVYPMPKLLIEAYEKSSNPQNLLADLPVIRTGPLSKNRRIGPELSKKIYTLMMSSNPDDVI
jgi:crossover junction endonuclease EME1